jgi:DNA polymerase-3 subunit gamma/tau
MAILRDLAEIAHWVSVIKITPEAAEDPTVGPDERARGREMAGRLPMRVLTRMWQMLLKALEEVAMAPNAMMAAEMAVIRLTHVADLPSPEELVRKLQDNPPGPGGGGVGVRMAPAGQTTGARGGASAGGVVQASGAVIAGAVPDPLARYARFEDVVELIRAHRDVHLLVEVEGAVRVVRYAPGRIEFTPAEGAAGDLAQRLAGRLQAWTGVRWAVSVVAGGAATTIAEARDAEATALRQAAAAHPLVAAVLHRFPKAKITEVRTEAAKEEAAGVEALAEVPDEWDPFEED